MEPFTFYVLQPLNGGKMYSSCILKELGLAVIDLSSSKREHLGLDTVLYSILPESPGFSRLLSVCDILGNSAALD